MFSRLTFILTEILNDETHLYATKQTSVLEYIQHTLDEEYGINSVQLDRSLHIPSYYATVYIKDVRPAQMELDIKVVILCKQDTLTYTWFARNL